MFNLKEEKQAYRQFQRTPAPQSFQDFAVVWWRSWFSRGSKRKCMERLYKVY